MFDSIIWIFFFFVVCGVIASVYFNSSIGFVCISLITALVGLLANLVQMRPTLLRSMVIKGKILHLVSIAIIVLQFVIIFWLLLFHSSPTIQLSMSTPQNLQFAFKGHSDPVRSVAWSPDGKPIASASYDNKVQVWSASTGTEVST